MREGVRIGAWTVTTAAGVGREAFIGALRTNRCLLAPEPHGSSLPPSFTGRVDGLDKVTLPHGLESLDARVNRLAWLAVQQDGWLQALIAARERHGPARVALVLGTSSSSIGESEAAYRRHSATGSMAASDARPEVHTLHAPALFVQRALGLQGLALTVSTACSSSAMAFQVARRWLAADLADAVVVAGVDAMCDSVCAGFSALQLLSALPCRPFDARRDGISLGEAAGFALLQRDDGSGQGPRLLGVGASSDAHHMSAPHPEGLGARTAMRAALTDAAVDPSIVDFIHLHGTGTPLNDATEAAAIADVWAQPPHAASTKGALGHTLGAAGMLGAAACWVALERGWRAGTAGLDVPDAGLPIAAAREPVQISTGFALSNAFGFGGTNVSLLFVAESAHG